MNFIRISTAFFVLSASSLWAESSSDSPPPPPGHPPHAPLFELFDANDDGVIDSAEIANAPAILKKLAEATSGTLTLKDIAPPPPDRPAPPPNADDSKHKRPVPPIFAALDTDSDGTLSADEIANAGTSLKTLDKNGDGKITIDEARPTGRGGRHGPPPPAEDHP